MHWGIVMTEEIPGSNLHRKQSTGSYMYCLLYPLYCTQKGMDFVWSHVAISWHKGLCFVYWWVGCRLVYASVYFTNPTLDGYLDNTHTAYAPLCVHTYEVHKQ